MGFDAGFFLVVCLILGEEIIIPTAYQMNIGTGRAK